MTRRALTRVLAGLLPLLLAGGGAGAEADRPAIVGVAAPARLPLGRVGDARITYRAPRADVVALVQVVEDLDGAHPTTRQRELGVVAAAFGRETGELVVPLAFATPGRKRVVLTLLTDEREESDPVGFEIEVVP